MTRSRPVSIVLMSLLVVGFGACSKPAPPASDATNAAAAPARPIAGSTDAALPHPCTLLTAKDAEAVLGPGAQVTRESVDTCTLKSATSDSSIDVKVEELDRDTWDGGETMMMMDKDARKVTGIGESGYTFMRGSIVFAKGRAEVTVIMSVYKGSVPAFEAAQVIAKKVAAAL